MKKTLAAGLLGLITLASPLLAEETLTATETAAITTTVNQLMTDLIRNGEALNADKMFAPLSDEPGAIFFTNGRPYSRPALVAAMTQTYAGLKRMSVTISHSQVKVLGRDTAIWLGWGVGKTVDKRGATGEEVLSETWIWQRLGRHWQVVHYHETVSALPDAALKDKVAAALTRFAAELQHLAPTADTAAAKLDAFLRRSPEVLGSRFAFAPERGTKTVIQVCRHNGRFERVTAPAGTDYTTQEWYAKADPAGAPTWSAPYRDATGAFVVTCSLRVLEGSSGKPIGVVTADLAL
jgi:hypothetical protein